MPDSADDTPDGGDSIERAQATDQTDTPAADDSTATGDPILHKRIADTEASLKEMQREFHRLSLEKARLEGETAALRDKGNKEPESKDWVEDEDWRQTFNSQFSDDPAKALAGSIKQLRSEFASLLKQRDEYLEGKAREYATEAADPTRQQVRSVIDEMRSESWFAALDSKTQVEVAKLKISANASDGASAKSKSLKPPSTGPAGSGSRLPAQPKGDDRSKRAEAAMASIWGGAKDADADLYPMGKE